LKIFGDNAGVPSRHRHSSTSAQDAVSRRDRAVDSRPGGCHGITPLGSTGTTCHRAIGTVNGSFAAGPPCRPGGARPCVRLLHRRAAFFLRFARALESGGGTFAGGRARIPIAFSLRKRHGVLSSKKIPSAPGPPPCPGTRPMFSPSLYVTVEFCTNSKVINSFAPGIFQRVFLFNSR
jgi:hypothetical protein